MNNETETNTDTQCIALETRVVDLRADTPAEVNRRIIESAESHAAKSLAALPPSAQQDIVRSLLTHFFGLSIFRSLLKDGDIGEDNALRLATIEAVLQEAGVRFENRIKEVD